MVRGHKMFEVCGRLPKEMVDGVLARHVMLFGPTAGPKGVWSIHGVAAVSDIVRIPNTNLFPYLRAHVLLDQLTALQVHRLEMFYRSVYPSSSNSHLYVVHFSRMYDVRPVAVDLNATGFTVNSPMLRGQERVGWLHLHGQRWCAEVARWVHHPLTRCVISATA